MCKASVDPIHNSHFHWQSGELPYTFHLPTKFLVQVHWANQVSNMGKMYFVILFHLLSIPLSSHPSILLVQTNTHLVQTGLLQLASTNLKQYHSSAPNYNKV